jgi:hypothetical protein
MVGNIGLFHSTRFCTGQVHIQCKFGTVGIVTLSIMKYTVSVEDAKWFDLTLLESIRLHTVVFMRHVCSVKTLTKFLTNTLGLTMAYRCHVLFTICRIALSHGAASRE